MKAISLFSGGGGMDLGLHRAGITTVAMCEIDKHARATLAHHWPDTPIHDDVTTFDARSLHGTIDLVHGGSPCQDLSVAGRRGGLAGARSGLFWHQCRIAAECAAPWVLWENVPGALSSNGGRDFAAVLFGLTGAHPDVPAEGWRNMGVLVGPTRFAVWRILDARWFGVAQRRRRVFVVSGPAALLRRGLQVLLESENCDRDSRPGTTSGQDVAGTLGGGSGSRGWSSDTDRMTFVPVRRLSHGHYVEDQCAGTLGASHAHDPTTSDLVPFVKVVRSGARDADGNLPPEVWAERDTAPTLNAMDNTGETRATVLATSDLAVRRLTPVECERLMGWPDNWTVGSDRVRYQQCGNGVVAPVAEWIGRRLMEAAA